MGYLRGEVVRERFIENDLCAKVASEAPDRGMDAASMLGHMARHKT